MSASCSVNIAELIDQRPLGRTQIAIIVLCGLVALLDGFDLLAIGVASSGLIAVATLLYSKAIRSTGVGWAMGLGRFGSFVGPLAIGLLVNRGWQVGDSFVAIGAPALCAAFFTSLTGINRQEKLSAFHQKPTINNRDLHHEQRLGANGQRFRTDDADAHRLLGDTNNRCCG